MSFAKFYPKSVLNREVIRCWSYLLNLKIF
nr:MAG TPA: hypothetical protein [Caudoviricetes sp.]